MRSDLCSSLLLLLLLLLLLAPSVVLPSLPLSLRLLSTASEGADDDDAAAAAAADDAADDDGGEGEVDSASPDLVVTVVPASSVGCKCIHTHTVIMMSE